MIKSMEMTRGNVKNGGDFYGPKSGPLNNHTEANRSKSQIDQTKDDED
jgi:hypothetical protein